MPRHPTGAKQNATYYGDDMRWMIWQVVLLTNMTYTQ